MNNDNGKEREKRITREKNLKKASHTTRLPVSCNLCIHVRCVRRLIKDPVNWLKYVRKCLLLRRSPAGE